MTLFILCWGSRVMAVISPPSGIVSRMCFTCKQGSTKLSDNLLPMIVLVDVATSPSKNIEQSNWTSRLPVTNSYLWQGSADSLLGSYGHTVEISIIITHTQLQSRTSNLPTLHLLSSTTCSIQKIRIWLLGAWSNCHSLCVWRHVFF